MNKKKIGLSVAAAIVVLAGGWYFYATTFYTNPPLIPDFLLPDKPTYMADTSDESADYDSDDEEYGSDVVAVVNGEELMYDELVQRANQMALQQGVSLEEMDALVKGQLYQQALGAMVSHELLSQVVTDFGTTVSDETVDQELASLQEQVGGEAALKQLLAQEGSTMEEFRSQLRADLEIEAYLDDQLALSYIEVTDEEVEEFYDELSEYNNLRPLEDAWDTFRQMTIEQKKQEQIAAYVNRLRQEGDVEILY